ncbi:MAG: hypothetical protein EOM21_18620 [Gammaproteobacteria bacterium]|nr:hypothetical protein [Gammaproteobacteria bacterium]
MWTERIPFGFPADLIDTANRFAAIIDPLERGDLTFSLDRQIDGYVVASSQFVEGYDALLTHGTADEWYGAMLQLCEERSREPMTLEEVTALHEAILVGDDVPTEDPAE